MLVIYHFYDWTWSFCYCAYSNTFLSSLSSLHLLFNCITIVNLLHYRNCCFLYYPYYLFVAGSHLNDLNAVSNQNTYQRDVIDAQKLLSGKKFIALLECRDDQTFETQEFIHKNAVCKGSEDPWKVLEEKVFSGNFYSRRRLQHLIKNYKFVPKYQYEKQIYNMLECIFLYNYKDTVNYSITE